MSRSLGWTLLTTRSPIEMVPEVIFSRPASIRSKVDLPQPEGPTRTTNSPSSIGIDTPCRTSKLPNDFRTSRICTDDIHFLQFHAAWRAWPRSRSSHWRWSYQKILAMSLDQSRRRVPFPSKLRRRRGRANVLRHHEHYAQ